MIYEVMYSIRDGETEYGDKFFVVAPNPDAAWTNAYIYLLDNYWDAANPQKMPSPGDIRNGVELPNDYRILSLVGIYPSDYITTVNGYRIRLEVVKNMTLQAKIPTVDEAIHKWLRDHDIDNEAIKHQDI